jgi:hypothetical protein
MDCASAKRYHAALDLPAGCSVRLPPVSVWSVVVLNFVLALHGRARVQKLGGAATFGCIARDLPDLQRGLKELHPGCVNFRALAVVRSRRRHVDCDEDGLAVHGVGRRAPLPVRKLQRSKEDVHSTASLSCRCATGGSTSSFG